MNEKIQLIVLQIIALLVVGDFQKIIELTRGVRMSNDEISSALNDYGKTLVTPPPEAFELMDVVEIEGTNEARFSVRMPLWTQEEGRSDLTLEISIKALTEKMEVELDDIHVL